MKKYEQPGECGHINCELKISELSFVGPKISCEVTMITGAEAKDKTNGLLFSPSREQQSVRQTGQSCSLWTHKRCLIPGDESHIDAPELCLPRGEQ